MTGERPRVKAIETTFTILDTICENSDTGVTALATEVGVSKSAVYKHLQTLLHLGYIYQDEDGYHLSNQFRRLSTAAGQPLPLDNIRRIVGNLAETTGNISNFIAPESTRGVYIVRKSLTSIDLPHTAGDHAPLHASAGGKAILAFLPPAQKAEVLDQLDFEAYTEKTITDRSELEDQLQAIHDRRVAYDRQEFVETHHCVASPVIGAGGEPVGAISVTGDVSRMSGKRLEEDVVGLVTGAAQSLETEVLSKTPPRT